MLSGDIEKKKQKNRKSSINLPADTFFFSLLQIATMKSSWRRGSRLLASANDRNATAVARLWCQCGGRYLSSSSKNDNEDESPEQAHIQKKRQSLSTVGRDRLSQQKFPRESWKGLSKLMGEPLQQPAGALLGPDIYVSDDESDGDRPTYIPEVSLYEGEGRDKKRILLLCTGGTLTMAPDPKQGGALAPVEGAISKYMSTMEELNSPDLPFEYHLHEYFPFRDSSDLGPADWATVARDIKVRRKEQKKDFIQWEKCLGDSHHYLLDFSCCLILQANYLHFDGFVVLTGTDTMAYFATALSFMLENLGKPVVFTGAAGPTSNQTPFYPLPSPISFYLHDRFPNSLV